MLLAAKTYFNFCFRRGWLHVKLFYTVAAVMVTRCKFLSTAVRQRLIFYHVTNA